VQISELNDSEREWLGAHLRVAKSVADAYAGADAESPLTPALLDAAWNAWIPTAAQDPEMANTIVNAIGAAFGQFLADSDGFRWVVASDEHGTEMAIIALEGTADVILYPMNLVAKRYESGEQGFILPVLEQIRNQVSNLSK
jgi:Domain of unknown function (DUF3806)